MLFLLVKYSESNIRIPNWIQGIWLSIGNDRLYTNTFHINKSHIIMKINDSFKSLKILQSKQQHKNIIRLRAKSLGQW